MNILWWDEGHAVYHNLLDVFRVELSKGKSCLADEKDADCIAEQLWAVREGLA
jgi:hypothetical protein